MNAFRILEIGDHDHFKRTYPAETTLLWTGRRPSRNLDPGAYRDCTPRRLRAALAALRGHPQALVVAYAGDRTPFHPRHWLRALATTPHTPVAALLRVFGAEFLRLTPSDAPMVVLDMQDRFSIGRSNLFLLDRARLYFKRELPVDAWQAFYGVAHRDLPTNRIRSDRRWRDRVAKLRPISLHAGEIDIGDPEAVFAAKTADVFFAGDVERNSTVRRCGLAELRALAAQGVHVDIPAEPLPAEEFHRRMSRAWLSWSPSGRGWDCYRHYEAPQCLSVPVINHPTILRHSPLADGEHAVYYAPEPGGLSRAITAALADKARLRAMALAARGHVKAHHAGRAFCDYVLAEAFGPSATGATAPGRADPGG